ncbi:ABC transporter permease [Pyrococcus furiosus DSM 3638]|uniref:ABC transporter permease n=3 Tax=Pyrococcus furiosus TaxID=2261 RepID=A0A5C0XQ75_PYRFU|nr:MULTISPECIES: ABC transporter permease [Pyrococcus]AAL81136.1 putative ABC transporter (ATP-binding protein) [Pyrococcus furiosus DSM 3638]AFN03807.1 ABC transporter [Pyrococcus furiosus COM1]MDK2870051.1 type transport system permease protein [Pyrococcus sp.]QEK78675.1 ABC transporter permease [Pyrococcus furiosus DSM 3638]
MNLRAIKAILIKDLKEIRREKMVVFWIFVFPLMWVTLMGALWGGPGSPVTVDVGVVNPGGNISTLITEIMENSTINGTQLFNVKLFPNASLGIEALKHGSIKALVLFPEDFDINITSGLQGRVLVYFDKTDPQNYQIVSSIIRSFFSEVGREFRARKIEMMMQYIPTEYKEYLLATAEPIVLEEKIIHGESGRGIKFYVTSFIGIQFFFATMLMIGGSVLEEITKGTLRRIAASPTTPWDFLIGKSLSTLTTIIVSIIIGIGYARVVFGATLFPSLFGWAIIFTAAVFSMSLGLAIVMLTRSERSTPAVVNLVSMPLLFLAGIVIPESIMPEWARPIAHYFPLGRALKVLRLSDIYGRPPGELVGDFIYVLIWSVLMAMVAVASYAWAIRRID